MLGNKLQTNIYVYIHCLSGTRKHEVTIRPYTYISSSKSWILILKYLATWNVWTWAWNVKLCRRSVGSVKGKFTAILILKIISKFLYIYIYVYYSRRLRILLINLAILVGLEWMVTTVLWLNAIIQFEAINNLAENILLSFWLLALTLILTLTLGLILMLL